MGTAERAEDEERLVRGAVADGFADFAPGQESGAGGLADGVDRLAAGEGAALGDAVDVGGGDLGLAGIAHTVIALQSKRSTT